MRNNWIKLNDETYGILFVCKDQGCVSLVSKEAFELLQKYDVRWCGLTDGSNGKVYVFTNGSKPSGLGRKYLHNLIMDTPKGMVTDHISGDTLDNRNSNLRVVTHAQNMRNKKVRRDNKLGVKGVKISRTTGKYEANITVKGKRKYIGTYETVEEAAKAFQKEWDLVI